MSSTKPAPTLSSAVIVHCVELACSTHVRAVCSVVTTINGNVVALTAGTSTSQDSRQSVPDPAGGGGTVALNP